MQIQILQVGTLALVTVCKQCILQLSIGLHLYLLKCGVTHCNENITMVHKLIVCHS